jgi:hypothetical protein
MSTKVSGKRHSMNFVSDNAYGATAEILAAIISATRPAPSPLWRRSNTARGAIG